MARSAVLLKPVVLFGCHVLHSWPHDRLKHLQVRLGVHWTLEPVHLEAPAIDYANPRHHLFTVSVLARYDLVGVGRTPDDQFFLFAAGVRTNHFSSDQSTLSKQSSACSSQDLQPAGLKPRCLVRGCQGWSQMGAVWSPTKISAKDFPDLSGSHLQLLRSLSDMGCRIFLEENFDLLHFFICR